MPVLALMIGTSAWPSAEERIIRRGVRARLARPPGPPPFREFPMRPPVLVSYAQQVSVLVGRQVFPVAERVNRGGKHRIGRTFVVEVVADKRRDGGAQRRERLGCQISDLELGCAGRGCLRSR